MLSNKSLPCSDSESFLAAMQAESECARMVKGDWTLSAAAIDKTGSTMWNNAPINKILPVIRKGKNHDIMRWEFEDEEGKMKS